MVALAARSEAFPNDLHAGPATGSGHPWGLRMPVMRAFPRLAVEPVDEPAAEARWDEEPERWDGMA